MEVANLAGADLDYWTGIAAGHAVEALKSEHGKCWISENLSGVAGNCWFEYSPSADWSIAGPLMEQMHIEVKFDPAPVFNAMSQKFTASEVWVARVSDSLTDSSEFQGQKATIAAMRAFVHAKFGPEVAAAPVAPLAIQVDLPRPRRSAMR